MTILKASRSSRQVGDMEAANWGGVETVPPPPKQAKTMAEMAAAVKTRGARVRVIFWMSASWVKATVMLEEEMGE